ncbi:hypothetical protein MKS88_000594 [Plasmodium brasilianum]|uniref:Uncharacterized protein n=1 Tax=Plasmodium brasilianum TaxID=5824 RepID=A0ACB9YHE5_PLABR|nr:hypothetical protein MKS88_000594 [Plasmodium brasilianum]
MEKNIKSHFFIKTDTFILLTWIFYFYIKLCMFSKFVGEYNYEKKLDLINCRFLAEFNQYINSRTENVREIIHQNVQNEKKVITDNVKWDKRTNKKSSKSSLYKEEFNKRYIRQRKSKYRGKYLTLFERKLFKYLDYIDFIRKNALISNKSCRNILLKEYALLIFLPALLLSWGLILPLMKYAGIEEEGTTGIYMKLCFVIFIILFSIFALGMAYMFIKIRKHKNIMKRR